MSPVEIGYYFARFARRFHWFTLCLVAGTAAGLAAAYYLAPRYAGEARLLMEAEQIPDELAASTVRTEAARQVALIRERVLRRDTVLELAEKLYPDAPLSSSVDRIVEDMRDRIDITASSGRDAPMLVTVGFMAETAAVADRGTREIVDLVLREDVRMRLQSAGKTLDFFRAEVARLATDLTAQDLKILAFREQNKNALPDSLGLRRSQQATGQDRLVQVDRQIDAVQAQLTRSESQRVQSDVSSAGQTRTPEQQQLSRMEDELVAQSTLLSPENPRVRILRARLSALQDRIALQDAGSKTPPGGSEYDVHRAEAIGELDLLVAEKARLVAALAELSSSIEATTANAITLANLERAQTNTRLQYDRAVANMARAETGDMIETLQQGQKLSLFESAHLLTEAARPNRRMMVLAGIGGGAIAGLALVIMLETMTHVLRRPEDLVATLGISAFSTLPYLPTHSETRLRVGTTAFAGAMVIAVPVCMQMLLPIARGDRQAHGLDTSRGAVAFTDQLAQDQNG